MSAKDYPVYFPYGATSPPYSAAHPHLGDDCCNVWGEEVEIEGIVIGLVGATGDAYDSEGRRGTKAAAHLHSQEWLSSVTNTRKPQNKFKPGIVVAAGTASEWGNYVTIRNDDGWNTTYAHLEKVFVNPGQLITGGNMTLTAEDVDAFILATLYRNATEQDIKDFTGKSLIELRDAVDRTDERKAINAKVWAEDGSGNEMEAAQALAQVKQIVDKVVRE